MVIARSAAIGLSFSEGISTFPNADCLDAATDAKVNGAAGAIGKSL